MTQEIETALVTGAARGIGRATAQRLAADGFHVVLADINGDEAKASAAEITAKGHAATGAALDIRDRAAVVALLETLPRIDAVVNNAAIFWDGPFEAATVKDLTEMFEVNVVGMFIVAQEAARRMQPGGRIVNISSRAYLGGASHAAYTASKAAVVGLTRGMAIDLAPRGITVNAVAPGLVETPMFRSLSPDRQRDILKLQLSGTIGTPEDLAHAVAFFASRGARYCTGQVLVMDGGKSLGSNGQ
jgi:3-oxoacyl-[acyl-carrier protein] reductase